MQKVTRENIFESMIYLQTINLQNSLPHLRNGHIYGSDNKPLGHEENPYSKGAYVIYDGEAILEKVRPMAVRKGGIGSPIETPRRQDLVQYIHDSKDSDVTLLYNTASQKITPLKGELKNHAQGEDLEKILSHNLPADFAEPHAKELNLDYIGTKTANAVFIPYLINKDQEQDVRTIVVKRSPYGSLGMGKVAEFGKEGLTREFFMYQDHNHQGPFIDAKNHIVGEMREYIRQNDQLVAHKTYYVHIPQEGDIKYVEKDQPHKISPLHTRVGPTVSPSPSFSSSLGLNV